MTQADASLGAVRSTEAAGRVDAAVEEFMRLTASLAVEDDVTALLERILDGARRLTRAQAGRLYTFDASNRYLRPVIAQNAGAESPIVHIDEVPLRRDDKMNMTNVCVYCAVSGQSINLSDIYSTARFDITDFARLDRMTNYRTRSVYAASLRVQGDRTVGVLMLMNFKNDATGEIEALPKSTERLADAFASFAAVVLRRANLVNENKRLIDQLHATNRELAEENRHLREPRRLSAAASDKMIGGSDAMHDVFRLIETVAPRDVTVLVNGETGAGKERVARAIHELSARKGAFVAQNCSALPEALLESELFGHVKGAFSGATANNPGLLLTAEGGTVFLDEIGDMPLALQAKLLRVIQEREVRPVGAVRSVPINVRIVAATHRNLRSMIEEGSFREDLYYRLAVFPITVPPLRDRMEDIPLLIEYLLADLQDRHQKKIEGLSPSAFQALQSYDYPGNVRELGNVLERAFLLAEAGGHLRLRHLPREVAHAAAEEAPETAAGSEPASDLPVTDPTLKVGLKEQLEHAEQRIIARTLRDHGWNQTRSAETLQLSRRALVQKISKYGLREQS